MSMLLFNELPDSPISIRISIEENMQNIAEMLY